LQFSLRLSIDLPKCDWKTLFDHTWCNVCPNEEKGVPNSLGILAHLSVMNWFIIIPVYSNLQAQNESFAEYWCRCVQLLNSLLLLLWPLLLCYEACNPTAILICNVAVKDCLAEDSYFRSTVHYCQGSYTFSSSLSYTPSF